MELPTMEALARPITAAESREKSLRERRRKPRARVAPMYSAVIVRVLSERGEPVEGHALNISEGGLGTELDSLITPGKAVTVEFMVAGLGRPRPAEWPVFAATAEVVRNDDTEDFPAGPYKTALRFVKVPTIVQAQISRYIATHGS